jgi:hypothetical protein
MSLDIPIDRSFFTGLFGTKLLKNDKEIPTEEALKKSNLVALYFSASW